MAYHPLVPPSPSQPKRAGPTMVYRLNAAALRGFLRQRIEALGIPLIAETTSDVLAPPNE